MPTIGQFASAEPSGFPETPARSASANENTADAFVYDLRLEGEDSH